MRTAMLVLTIISTLASSANAQGTVHSTRILNLDPMAFQGVIGQSAPHTLTAQGCEEVVTYEDFNEDDDTAIPTPQEFMAQMESAEKWGYIFIRSHATSTGRLVVSSYDTDGARDIALASIRSSYPNINWYAHDQFLANEARYVYTIMVKASEVAGSIPDLGEGAMVLMGTCYGETNGNHLFPSCKALVARTDATYPGGVHGDYQSLVNLWLTHDKAVLNDAYDGCEFSSMALSGNDKIVFAPWYKGMSWEEDYCDREDENAYPDCILVDSAGLSAYVETIGPVSSFSFSSSDFFTLYSHSEHIGGEVYHNHFTVYNRPGAQGTGELTLWCNQVKSPDCIDIILSMGEDPPPYAYETSLYNIENPACEVTAPLEVVTGVASWKAVSYDSDLFELQCLTNGEVTQTIEVAVTEGENYRVTVPEKNEYVLIEHSPSGEQRLGKAVNRPLAEYETFEYQVARPPEQGRVLTSVREPLLYELMENQRLLVYTHPDLVVSYEYGTGYLLESLGVDVTVRGVPQSLTAHQKRSWIIEDRNSYIEEHSYEGLSIHLVGEATDERWFQSQYWQEPYWSLRFNAHMNNPDYPNEYDASQDMIPHFYHDDPDSHNVSYSTPYGVSDEPYYHLVFSLEVPGMRWPVENSDELHRYMDKFEHYILTGVFIDLSSVSCDLWLGESDEWYGDPGTDFYVPIIGEQIENQWPGPVRILSEEMYPYNDESNEEAIRRFNEGLVAVQGVANTSGPYYPAKKLWSRLSNGAFTLNRLRVNGSMPYMMMWSCNSAQVDKIEPFNNGEPVVEKLGRAALAGWSVYIGPARGTNQRANAIIALRHNQDLIENPHDFISKNWHRTRRWVLENHDNPEVIMTTNNYISLGHPLQPQLVPEEVVIVGVQQDNDDMKLNINNHPNPCNPNTMFSFTLPEDGRVCLDVYNLAGRHVSRLIDGVLARGYHQVQWDGKDRSDRAVSSGTYLYRLTSAKNCLTGKMSLIK